MPRPPGPSTTPCVPASVTHPARSSSSKEVFVSASARALRVLSVSNQKGGVGKTTTAINLGTALAAVGERVLIIDLDPQGNASTGLGVARHSRKITAYDVM